MTVDCRPHRPTTTPIRAPGAAALLATALVLWAGGCTEGGTAPPVPERVRVESGANQVGAAGEQLPVAITVRVEDPDGRPVPEVEVRWLVQEGGGTVTDSVTRTDGDGTAGVRWTLGTTAGGNTVTATAAGLTPATISATGVAGAPATATRVAGDGQTAEAGTAVPVAPAVRVADAYDNPVAQIAVSCAVGAGGGQVTAGPTLTGADGVAVVGAWTLGHRMGPNTLDCAVDGLAPVAFSAVGMPGAPAKVVAQDGVDQSGTVGEPVPVAPSVLVHDAHGNAVEGVAVAFEVTGGGGSIDGSAVETDRAGVAAAGEWTLGTAAGTQRVTAAVDGLDPVVFEATARPAAPARAAAYAGADQTAEAGSTVAIAPAVRVTDRYDNPVPAIPARCEVAGGGGTVTAADTATDGDGVAAVGAWRLGTMTGANALDCTVGELDPVRFSATGVAGAPVAVEAVAGAGQEATVNAAVPTPPAVRVSDRYGNPVEGVEVVFAVATGAGSLSGAVDTTDAEGRAAVGTWTLGPDSGTQTLTATAGDLPPVVFSAEATASTLNLFIEGVHLNQGNQTLTGSIGGVAGRPGLLRVVVAANQANTAAPDVRVRLYQNGSLLREEQIPAARGGVSTDPDLRDRMATWDLPLSAAEVREGLSVEVVVDPDETVAEVTRADNRYPRDVGRASLDVRPLPPLKVVFIPIQATLHGDVGSVTEANVSTFLLPTRQWIPTSTITPTVHAPVTTGQDLTTRDGWTGVLSEVQALRTVEGATDEYYHGIVPDVSGTTIAGIGYLNGSPGDPWRSAVSYDRGYNATVGSGYHGTIAHELGHNLGRRHAPCGPVAGADPAFPHDQARIGPPGYDITSGALITDGLYRDYMSYCSQAIWTSDYTYAEILAWRRRDSQASLATMAMSADAPSTAGLLLWGRIGPDGVVLNPAFSLRSRPALPASNGPNVLRGVDARGAEVFRLAFRGAQIADSPDPDQRHFSFFVPLSDEQMAAIERIELVSPAGSATRRRAPTLAPLSADSRTEVRVEPVAPRRARLRWDAARFPMALVRDPETGQVLAFARDGDVMLATPDGAERVEVLVSDGVHSRVAPR